MFTEGQIEALVEFFNQRGVTLYHSCQLKDFGSYLKLGGIPSRQLLSDCKLPFTKFETDSIDQKNGVWDKVFLNLQDFGAIFASGKIGVPTVYGPITFAISPEALRTASDVAICLRSAGISGFQREAESLKTIEEVNRLFCDIDRYACNRTSLKNRSQLRKAFGVKSTDYVSFPEISCTVPEGKLSLDFTYYLLIDPYHFNDKLLIDVVQTRLSTEAGRYAPFKVIQRSARDARYTSYNEIAAIVQKGVNNLEDFLNERLSRDLHSLLKQIQRSPEKKTQWRRYTKYFLEGTLQEL